MDEFNSGERNSVDDNLLAALCYWLCCLCGIPALILFIMKKDESPFIRFHSLQALIFTVVLIVLSCGVTFAQGIVLNVPVIGAVIAGIGGLIMFVISLAIWGYIIFVGIKAYNGEEFEIPILGSFIQEKFMS